MRRRLLPPTVTYHGSKSLLQAAGKEKPSANSAGSVVIHTKPHTHTGNHIPLWFVFKTDPSLLGLGPVLIVVITAKIWYICADAAHWPKIVHQQLKADPSSGFLDLQHPSEKNPIKDLPKSKLSNFVALALPRYWHFYYELLQYFLHSVCDPKI